MTRRQKTWAAGVAAAAALFGVLSLYQANAAAPRAEAPFGNSMEQRLDQISYLKEIRDLLQQQNALLREQNALLNSGKLQVVVTLPEK